jgi:PAS domain S-box-containing protein
MRTPPALVRWLLDDLFSMDPNATQKLTLEALTVGLPRLQVVRTPVPDQLGRTFVLGAGPMVLGRAQGAFIRFDDAGLSRQHARIVALPQGGHAIEDLGSTNGTFHNGQRVSRAELSEGDRIQIGSLTILRYGTQTLGEEELGGVGRALASAGIGLWDYGLFSGKLVGSANLTSIVGGGIDPLRCTPARLLQQVHVEQRAAVQARFVEALERGGQGELQLEVRLVDGEAGARWLLLQAEVRRDGDGTPLFVSGTVLEVSARKRAEEEMHRQAQLFEALSNAVVVIDLEGRVTEWPASAVGTFGLPAAAALGKPIGAVLTSDHGAALTGKLLGALALGGRWCGEVPALAKDGGAGVCEVTALTLRDVAKTPVAHILACRDVSERKRMEARLLLADRMSSVGTLAAGVAHEINNPLAFIRANLAYLADTLEPFLGRLPESERLEVSQVFAETTEGARRIEVIVRDLKTFSRADDRSACEPVHLRSMLGFALKMVENQLRHRARVEVAVDDALWVKGNEGRLSQVFVNLLVNAAQAIAEGDASHQAVRISAERAGGCITIAVTDSGSGMSPEVRARIFSPFFTTKQVGQGTGLGLSVSHAIITELGGEIAVESAPGQGSTFRVRLPAAVDPALRPPTPRLPEAPGRRPRAEVLVIDDDPLVAAALARSLDRDHHVTISSGGRDALEKLSSGSYDLIFCDLMMPDVSGMDLYAELEREHPELLPRVVFLTGGAFTPRAEQFLAAVSNPMVRKPFGLDELLAAGDQVLQGKIAAPMPPPLNATG